MESEHWCRPRAYGVSSSEAAAVEAASSGRGLLGRRHSVSAGIFAARSVRWAEPLEVGPAPRRNPQHREALPRRSILSTRSLASRPPGSASHTSRTPVSAQSTRPAGTPPTRRYSDTQAPSAVATPPPSSRRKARPMTPRYQRSSAACAAAPASASPTSRLTSAAYAARANSSTIAASSVLGASARASFSAERAGRDPKALESVKTRHTAAPGPRASTEVRRTQTVAEKQAARSAAAGALLKVEGIPGTHSHSQSPVGHLGQTWPAGRAVHPSALAAKGLAARVGGSAGGTVHSHSTRRINPNRLVPSSVPSPTAYPYYAASRQSLMPGKAARTVATHS
eukprot:jgi/Tetstr1/437682/TSEL_000240.t1